MKKILLLLSVVLFAAVLLAATRKPVYVGSTSYIDAGNKIVSTTSSNILFNVTFSAAPVVVCTGSLNTNTWITTITTTNFTINGLGSTNQFNWIAIGGL